MALKDGIDVNYSASKTKKQMTFKMFQFFHFILHLQILNL